MNTIHISYIHYILRVVFPDVWYHLIPHYIPISLVVFRWYSHISPYCWWMLMVCIPWSSSIMAWLSLERPRPVPPVLSLAKSLRPRFPGPGANRTWKSLGKTWKTPKNPLNPPLFPLKIGKNEGWNLHFKTDPVGLTILLKPSTHYSQHNQHNGMIDMDCSLSKSMLTVSLKKTQVWMVLILLPSGKQAVCYRKLSFLIGKSMNSTAIFNSKLLQITRGVSSGKSSSMAPFLSL